MTATDACGSTTSTANVTVGIDPPPVAGTASVAPSPICINTNTTLTLVGHTGNIQWQSAPAAGGPWTDIGGATTANYSYGPVTANTFFQAVVSNSCQSETSNVTSVQIIQPPDPQFTSTTVCQGSPTVFTNNTPNPGSITTWLWNFDNGSNSGQQSPQITYAAPGTYNVTLTATDNIGCTNSITNTVTVSATPTANFTSALTCANANTALTDQSTITAPSTISQWAWDIGADGSVDYNSQSPSHTFGVGGTYNVSLTVTSNGGCSHSVTLPVTAAAIPVAAFSASTECVGFATQFTDQSAVASGNITGWAWQFGDGSTASTQNPTNTYGAANTYNATLTVTTNNGCTHQVTNAVDVISLPQPNFTSTTVCAGSPTVFTDQTPGTMTGYSWSFAGQGVSAQQNPQFTFNADGTFNVQLTVTAGTGCQNSVTLPVSVSPMPTANFTSALACANANTALTDQSTVNAPSAINQWAWDIGADGSVDYNSQSPSHTFGTGGTYNVSLTVTTNGGCSNSVTLPVVAAPIPVAAFAAPTVCIGATSNFTDQSVVASGNITGWAWQFGDGSTANTQNPTNTYAADGIYNTTLTVTTNNGCTHAVTQQVFVTPLPTADFTVAQGCQGVATEFTDQSTDVAGISQWAWDFDGNGASAQQNPQFIFANDGTFNVTLLVTSLGGCQNTVTLPVVVYPNPVADFTSTTVCAQQASALSDLSTVNAPGVIVGWAWDIGADGTPEYLTQNANHTFPAGGTFNVALGVVTDAGCTDVVVLPVTAHAVPVAVFTGTSECLGTASSFTDQSTVAIGNIAQWDWTLGPLTDNSQNPTVTFPTTGQQNIGLTVTTDQGCTHTANGTVQVYVLPTAGFTFQDICIYEAAIFTNTSSVPNGNITQYQWDFGNGNTSNSQLPTGQSYPNPGTYAITLDVATNNGCTDSYTQNILVSPEPTANFSFIDVCEGTPTNFTDLSMVAAPSTIATWAWQFGNGQNGNTQNPQHTYGAYGTYTATLTVTTDKGCVATVSNGPVTVFPVPVAEFAPNLANCLNVVTDFFDMSTVANGPTDQIVSWAWDLADGTTATTQNTSHTYTSAAIYPVQLTIETNNGCMATVTHNVEIYPLPSVNFRADTTRGCQPFLAQFIDLSTIPAPYVNVAWEWDFTDGGSTSTGQYPMHLYNDPNIDPMGFNVFPVSLTVTSANGCVSDTTFADYMYAYPKPEANFTVDRAVVDILDPTVRFTDQSSANVVDWFWLFGDGGSATIQHPSHTYPDTLEYPIIEYVETAYGCRDTAVFTIEVKPVFTFYIPNTFTPNEDAINSTWGGYGTGVKSYSMLVFNRWGEQIYESYNLEHRWDGTYKNRQVQQGTYSYLCLVYDIKGEVHEYVGHVNVLR